MDPSFTTASIAKICMQLNNIFGFNVKGKHIDSTKMSTYQKSKTWFRTDGNVAIHVNDLQKAEYFYSNVLAFLLISKTENQLVYDTGVIRLYINKDEIKIPFIPALEVRDYNHAKEH